MPAAWCENDFIIQINELLIALGGYGRGWVHDVAIKVPTITTTAARIGIKQQIASCKLNFNACQGTSSGFRAWQMHFMHTVKRLLKA